MRTLQSAPPCVKISLQNINMSRFAAFRLLTRTSHSKVLNTRFCRNFVLTCQRNDSLLPVATFRSQICTLNVQQRYFSDANKNSPPPSSRTIKKDDATSSNSKDEDEKKKDDDLEDREETLEEELAKLNLFQRYKKLLKDYWYICLPTHALTSCLWFGSAFLAVKL